MEERLVTRPVKTNEVYIHDVQDYYYWFMLLQTGFN
jgi:hypothetical protein